MAPKQGFLYIASGKSHIPLVERSAKSLKKVEPDAHITLFTSRPEDEERLECPEVFDTIKIMDYTQQKRDRDKGIDRYFTGKMDHLWNSPYEKTFYLDADTYVFETLSPVFELLNYFDVLMAHSGRAFDIRNFKHPYTPVPGATELNGGVIIYRKNDKTKKWCKLIKEYFYTQNKGFGRMQDYTGWREQSSILWAILHSDVRLFTLCGNYNVFNRRPSFLAKGPVRLLQGVGKTSDLHKQRDQINSTLMDRVWVPSEKRSFD